MPRFFIDSIPENEIYLDGENGRHLVSSLRIREGEEVVLCDGKGKEGLFKVNSTDKNGAYLSLIEKSSSLSEASLKLNIYQCLPKSDKMELIIQKITELGAYSLVPVSSRNCVADIKAKEEKKLQRWQKIALEAAKQSGRGVIPQIHRSLSFNEAIKNAQGTKILFYEKGGISLKEATEKIYGEVSIFIGPEGGFDPVEIEFAKNEGTVIVGLGKRILRTETAAIAAAAVIMFATGNME